MLASRNVLLGALLMGVALCTTTNSTFDTCVTSDCEIPLETSLQITESSPQNNLENKENILKKLSNLSNHCLNTYLPFEVQIPTEFFNDIQEKVTLISRVLEGYFPCNEQHMLLTFIQEVTLSDDMILSGRILWIGNGSFQHPDHFVAVHANSDGITLNRTLNEQYVLKDNVPWLSYNENFPKIQEFFTDYFDDSYEELGWTSPYYNCEDRKWLFSFTSFVLRNQDQEQNKKSIIGVISVDIDITDLDINQCDNLLTGANVSNKQIKDFLKTHKCDRETSECLFTSGHGWTVGGYKCVCKKGYYSATNISAFDGSAVETTYKAKIASKSPTYDLLYVCKKCQSGCDECLDDSPCLSTYNWAFRISLLTISMLCIVFTLMLSAYVYRYRKLKVFKVASPIFLCVTLLGCIIMYFEMAAIFPVLDMYSCIATKWTRHMGFCITYSALLLKTWRVSLTYRVKSAHKLKLTDKQLLQWLFPILLVMAIYLGTWTISSPPAAVYIKDWHQLKFKQCDYNWWDHSLAIGEFMFLLWGIKVCYNVRNAESVFNEARHISWAVHSITIVNIIMVLIHLIIFPEAGPDIKYLFGFARTQLSTTITILLIFGPKFYRVITGQGDTWDNRARARGVTASFSLNGVGPVYEEPQDLCIENEELKEEVQKLASQIEYMKIVHMEINNRHLKPKHGGFFSQPSNNQSPVLKNIYMKFDSTDSPGSRISPAAELVSEKV